MPGQEGKPPSELDAKIAEYHRKVKGSRMQAISLEDIAHYIHLEDAHASMVSAYIEGTYCIPPNILSAGSYGGGNPPSRGVATKEVH